MLDLNNLIWYDISETEEQAIDSHGNVFNREKNIETLPLSCSICENMLSTIEDMETIRTIGCCKDCETVYYYPNKEKWNNGWRPEK